jgi:hypothetical protein
MPIDMAKKLPPTEAWVTELAGYQTMRRELAHKGLDAAQIERSRQELSHLVDGMLYLNREAYLPTGVALGCPLPDDSLTRRLWRLARFMERQLTELSATSGPSIAFVPPQHYHITIVNYTHFESTSSVVPLKQHEKERVEETLRTAHYSPTAIWLNGIVLTSSGKLLVTGYPCSDFLDSFRKRIVSLIPETKWGVPKGATIKLGHMTVSPGPDETARFIEHVTRCRAHICHRLEFDSAYTQHGRIQLLHQQIINLNSEVE